MSVFRQIKKEIEEALLHPPETEQMLGELRMNNIRLRQTRGDIEMFSTINKNLIEKVWKTMKIYLLLEKNTKEFKKIGLNSKNLSAQRETLIERVNNILNNPHQNPVEGFVKDGFIELEVFKTTKQSKN